MRGSLPSSLKFSRIENLLGPFFLLARFGTNGGKGVARSFGGEEEGEETSSSCVARQQQERKEGF